MTQDPEAIRADIDARRDDLTRDVDALNDRVNPARVASRTADRARGRAARLRDSVMGGQHDSASVSDRASDAASGATDTAHQQVQGHPIAAGLIAFGAGMVLSSLIPASEAEARASGRLVEAAKEHGQPVVEEAKQAGQDVAAGLQDHAKSAAQDVAGSAQESVDRVKGEAQSSAQSVKDDATS